VTTDNFGDAVERILTMSHRHTRTIKVKDGKASGVDAEYCGRDVRAP
jgi:hypothetical protein